MIDLVIAEGMKKSPGISRVVPVSKASNFFEVRRAQDAKSAARGGRALAYFPSYEADEGALVELARGGGAVVFSLSDLLGQRGFKRGILISKMRLLVAAARKRGCASVVCTLARSERELRTGRELLAFACVIGFCDVEIKKSARLAEELVG